MRSNGVLRARRPGTGLLGIGGLRVRLVVIALCLLTAGAGIISSASILAAREFLMRQAGQQLRADAELLASRPFTAVPRAPSPDVLGRAVAIEVLSSGGQLVMKTGQGVLPAPAAARFPARARELATVRGGSGGGSWLVVAEPVRYRARRLLFDYGADSYSLLITGTARPGTAATMVVGLSLASVSQALRRLTLICAAVSGAAILAVALLGLVVIRVILRPLSQAAETAAAVAAGDISRRVPDRHARDAAGGLARSLNAMLDHLEDAHLASAAAEETAVRSAERTRRVLAATAAELQRPLSVIAGFAGQHRHRGQLTRRELDTVLTRVADETARMDTLVDNLSDHAAAQLPPSAAASSEE